MRSFLMCVMLIPLWIVPVASVCADDVAIAVLDFELNDLTLQPNTPEELQRTASIKPLLQQTLATKYGYQVVEVDPQTQEKANAGFGYLFDHHDVAAQLGRDVEAEWVVVGRVHKASFLFVYIMAHVINAKTGKLVGDLIVEIKGPQSKLTMEGVKSLAEQIANTLQRSG